MRFTDHATFAAAERDVYDGTFPRHPCSQCAHFVERNVGSKPDPALCRTARDRMLDSIAFKNFDPAVIEHDRDIDREFH